MKRSYWLLSALAPILLAACWLATWQERTIWRVAFAPNGRLLATVGHLMVSQPLAGPQAAYGEVALWDPATGRRLRARRQPQAFTSLAFSPDGKTLAIGDDEGTIALLNPDTLEPVGRRWHSSRTGTPPPTSAAFRTPEAVTFLEFAGDGRTLVSASADNTVRLWDTRSGRQAAMVKHDTFLRVVPTHAGQQLAVSFYGGGASNGVKFYDISKQRLELVDNLAGIHWEAVSTDGKRAVVTTAAGNEVWNCQTRRTEYMLPASRYLIATFSRDGQLLAVAGDALPLTIFDAASGQKLSTATLKGQFTWSMAFAPDGRSIAATWSDGAVHLWDAPSLAHRCRLPDNTAVFWSFLGVVAAFVAWSIAWVGNGRGDPRRWRAAADVALIGGSVLGAMLLRLALTSSEQGFARPETAVALGLTAALVMSSVVWAALGTLRWQLRLPGVMVSLAAGWLISFALESGGRQQWEIVISTAPMLLLMVGVLRWLRWRGWTIIPPGNAEQSGGNSLDAPTNARQFRLKDLAIWTAALALLLAVGRHASPAPLAPWALFFLAVTGLELSLVILAAFWSGLANSHLLPRLVVASVVTSICGSVHAVCFNTSTSVPGWWFSLLNGSLAAFTLAATTVFRLHGYRLCRWTVAGSRSPEIQSSGPDRGERTLRRLPSLRD